MISRKGAKAQSGESESQETLALLQNMTAREQIAAFNAERDVALLSLDEHEIRAMFRKWNGREMPQGVIFWRSVHKAITGSTGLPIEFRRQSKAWLDTRGLRSLDDGDL